MARIFALAVFMLTGVANAQPTVSSTYQHLIDRNWTSPFENRDAVKAEVANELGQKLADAIDQHIADENKLLQFREVLKARAREADLEPNQIAVSLMKRIAQNLENLEGAGLSTLIAAAHDHAEEFFATLDAQNQDRLDLTLAFSFHGLRYWIATNLDQLNKQEVDEFKKLYDTLADKLGKYLKNKDQFGQNKDTLRTSPYKSYFVTLEKFTRSKSSGAKKYDSLTFEEKIRKLGRGVVKAVVLPPRIVSVAKQVYLPANRPGLERPLGKAALGLIRAAFSQVDVRVHGEQNLPDPDPKSNKVYIFVSSHHDPVGDFVAIGELGLPYLVLYGAPNNFLKIPKPLKDFTIKKLDQNTGFIVVGAGKTEGSNEKAVRLVHETGARVLFNFSQGRLDEGIGGQAGIRDGIHDLVTKLTDAGYEPILVPISLRNTSRLFNGRALTDLTSNKPGLYVSGIDLTVFPWITPKLRKALVGLGGVSALNFVLRYGLLEDKDLMEDENIVLGGIRASRLIPLVSDYVGGPAAACVRSLLPAP